MLGKSKNDVTIRYQKITINFLGVIMVYRKMSLLGDAC